jgi:isorenieratene synthase
VARSKRILVIGAGPAGLSAGVHLKEDAGARVEVEIISMGHHLGGKAASWRDPAGYSIDHGFHAVFGFYDQMRSLARRAGVDLGDALVSSRGVNHFFDPDTGRLFTNKMHHGALQQLAATKVPYLTDVENHELSDAVVRMFRTVTATDNLESLDDVCFKAFMLEHGAPARFLRSPLYRQIEELAFNTPHEISTYIVLKGTKLLGHCYDDAVFSYIAGGISEKFWDPIGKYFEKLGGKLRIRQKLCALGHDGGKLTSLSFGIPDNPGFHMNGTKPWPVEVPVAKGSEFVESSFDAVICTLPAACFVELNPGDAALWGDPFFGNVRNLTSVSTISLQAWLKETPSTGIKGTVNGLSLPMSYAADQKALVPEFARDNRYGAAIEWVGAEDGYADVPDATLIADARADLARVPGFENTNGSEPVHLSLRRNRDNHQRYLLTDPGTLKFRPTVKTPLEGLFLAGDWVRNEIDIPTMEGAVRCGKEAAKQALAHLG